MAFRSRAGIWLSLVILSPGVEAAVSDPVAVLTVTPGLATPADRFSRYAENTYSLEGSLLFRVRRSIQMGVGGGYLFGSRLEGRLPDRFIGNFDFDDQPDPLQASGGLEVSLLHVTPLVKIGPFIEIGRIAVRPFFIGGGGYYRAQYRGGTLLLNGRTSQNFQINNLPRPVADFTEHKTGWNAGGGMDFYLVRHLALGAELRYHRVIDRENDPLAFLIPAARLSFLFP